MRVSKNENTPRDAEQRPLSVADLLAEHHGDCDPALPGRPSRMCRAIVVTTGIALLCGSGAAGATALSGPRVERALPSSATGSAVASITGAGALHPDLINTSVEVPPAGAAAAPPAGGGQDRPVEVPDAPGPNDTAPPVPQSTAAAPDSIDPPPPTPEPEPRGTAEQNAPSSVLNSTLGPILGTITTFYQSAPIAPRQAFTLLDPQMQGAGYDQFRQAWAGVRRAVVEDIQQNGPRAALVIVKLERDDGTVLRTLQQVLVTPGAQPRIADAQLLSASRS